MISRNHAESNGASLTCSSNLVCEIFTFEHEIDFVLFQKFEKYHVSAAKTKSHNEPLVISWPGVYRKKKLHSTSTDML